MASQQNICPHLIRPVVRCSLVIGMVSLLAACQAVADSPSVTAPSATPLAAAELCTYSASLTSDSGSEAVLAQPGQSTRLVWALRNEGSCGWAGVILEVIKPLEEGDSASSFVPAAKPGSGTDLAIYVTAPLAPGEYIAEWRLRAPDGTLFGPSLSATVEVQPPDMPTPVFPPSIYAVDTDSGCFLDLMFLADVNLIDGTVVQPNQPLQKKWRVQNTGTCDWPEGSSVVYRAGDVLVAGSSEPIPATRSGEITDITVTLAAPPQTGTYTGWWRLQSADGTLFGVSLYAMITVQGEGISATVPILPSITSAPTPTARPARATPTAAAATFASFNHNISFHSREIFLDGQTKGNRSNVFAKVGDSISESPAFLFPIGDGNYALGQYDYLQPAIGYFSAAPVRSGNSFNNPSVAAVWGWSTPDLLNPDHSGCPGVTPLECEYSTITPALAIIMIGTNDAIPGYALSTYEGNMRRIIEISFDYGVIPVLSTVPWNQVADVQPYNQVIVSLAVEYDIPWMDFFGASWDLPNHGINDDGVHPSAPSDSSPADFSTENLRYGYNTRNLLVLHMLDALWRQVLSY